MAVWEKFYNGKDHEKCVFCSREISLDTFQVGHDLALARGGTYKLDNLFPLCGACNKKMSTESFEGMYMKCKVK